VVRLNVAGSGWLGLGSESAPPNRCKILPKSTVTAPIGLDIPGCGRNRPHTGQFPGKRGRLAGYVTAGAQFTYLAPVLTDVTGLGVGWVPMMLALFGLGSFAGVTLAGRYADRRDPRLVFVAGSTLLLGWCVFALTASVPAAAVVLVVVQGLLSFAVGSTLISYALYAGSESPVLAGGLATASLNVGAALGPILGGAAITLTDYRAPLWVSALLVGPALCLAGGGRLRTGRLS
jgi:predicted MFS family arabinose efflux permease